MSKVVRYFHLRPIGSHKGGTCVKVVGDTDVVGQVDVQYYQCSRKDPYVKALGRSLADKAPMKIVPLRYLAKELGRLHPLNVYTPSFDFAIKYFLPKE